MSAEFPADGMCHETSGFLFNHKCDRFSVGKCSICRKPLCEDHTHLPPEGTQTLCTTCLKKKVQQDRRSNPIDDRSPSHSYHEYYYYHDPYFYGSSYYPGYGRTHTYHSTHSSSPPPQSAQSPDEVVSGDFSSGTSASDPNDFTEGDAESLRREDDADFESDMGAS